MNIFMLLISLLFLSSLSVMVIFTKSIVETKKEDHNEIIKYVALENLIILGILVISSIIYIITNTSIYINSEYNQIVDEILKILLVVCLIISLIFSVISFIKNTTTTGFINKFFESKVLIILAFPFSLYFTASTIKNVLLEKVINNSINKAFIIFYITYIFMMILLIFLTAFKSKKAKSQFYIIIANVIVHIIILIILGI